MNVKTMEITVNGLHVEVLRKDIKNLHLRVYPPDGRVRISVPKRLSTESIVEVVERRFGWIKKQQEKLAAQPIWPRYSYESGEIHDFRGDSYLLNVIFSEGPSMVRLNNNGTIDLIVRNEATTSHREKVLLEWYRQALRESVPPLIYAWQAALDVEVAQWRIKHMKTRWGSCNVAAKRVWLSLELAKKSPDCLEYVVVHELAHLIEKSHGRRFIEVMDSVLPTWRKLKAELNKGFDPSLLSR